ncbi:MAG TPA: HNH endonuclease signature motif containing protein [Saprospiraceae bacterium]|nr:HNH endonuclease signature motif containing protein [Saprospiraceae bacterium]
MRKILPPPEPEKLKREKTELLKKIENGQCPWRYKYIAGPLFEACNKRCAYCGNSINYPKIKELRDDYVEFEEKYLNIDHFIARVQMPDKAIDWDNLVPSCPKCNNLKRDHDVIRFKILMPYFDDAMKCFTISNGVFRVNYQNTDTDLLEKANMTFSLFNYQSRIVIHISKQFSLIVGELTEILKLTNNKKSELENNNRAVLNEIYERLTPILEMGKSSSKWGEIFATFILQDISFHNILSTLKVLNLETNELNELLNEIEQNCYA